MFSTRITTMRDFRSDWYHKWKESLALGRRIHRKAWEIAIVAETLESQGMLETGKSGVGFGVGSEFLPLTFASRTDRILATDLLPSDWQETHKHFRELNAHPRVQTRIVDMNWIDGAGNHDLVDNESYDFAWSVCSMDHCGTAWWTKRFLLNQMNCLRVGGIGVHTAEYTISSGLPREGPTIWLNRDDVQDVVNLLSQLGHEPAPIDWFLGDSFEDHGIDCPEYQGDCHIKAEVNGRWGTCICFAVRKKSPGTLWVPLNEAEARTAIADFQRSHSQT